MNKLHDYVFHFNQYSLKWCAIPRDKYNEYWSDYQTKGIIKNNSLEELIKEIKNL